MCDQPLARSHDMNKTKNATTAHPRATFVAARNFLTVTCVIVATALAITSVAAVSPVILQQSLNATQSTFPPVVSVGPNHFFLPIVSSGPVPLDTPRNWYALGRAAAPFDLITSAAVAADDTIFYSTKRGVIHSYKNGVSNVFLDMSSEVSAVLDRGLNGLAVSADGRYLYAHYVSELNDHDELRVARISRANPSLRDVIWRAGDLNADAHTAGLLVMGNDGNLYIGTGDGYPGASENAMFTSQNVNNLFGKVLRIDPASGGGLPSNPFWDGDPYSVRSQVFAMGMRNPFGGFWDATTAALVTGDVGEYTWEEVDQLHAGANYGWPCREAFATHYEVLGCGGLEGFEPPDFALSHDDGHAAITGVTRWYGRLISIDYGSGRVTTLQGSPIPSMPALIGPTFLIALQNGDLLSSQFRDIDGAVRGEVVVYSTKDPAADSTGPETNPATITINLTAPNTFTGIAILPDGSDVSANLAWNAIVHHNQHLHPDYATGSGPVFVLDRGQHAEGWIELCASASGGTTCMRVD